jgi:hypothetical protein
LKWWDNFEQEFTFRRNSTLFSLLKFGISGTISTKIHVHGMYSRNVMDVDWGLVVNLALPAKVTRRANKVIGIYDRSH